MCTIMAAFDREAADDDQGPYAQRRGAGRADAGGAVAHALRGPGQAGAAGAARGRGRGAGEIGEGLRLHAKPARFWLKRFNAHGLAGLEESERPGRPPTYPAEQVAVVIATALARPADLGLPFASWTLDRLAAHLGEAKGIAMR